jgi:hypothetical protein
LVDAIAAGKRSTMSNDALTQPIDALAEGHALTF